MNPNYILFAIPFFLLTVGGEWLHNFLKKGGKDFNFEDTLTNLNLGIGSQATNALAKAFILMIYAWAWENFAIWNIELSWWSFILCVIVFDYLYYWAHRWGHEWNIFWGAHIVHHQSQEYNLSVALRQSWFHNLLAFPIFLPLPFIGFDPMTFAAAAGFVTLYQYWIHTKLIHRMGWFEEVFNSPGHHRVHHATNSKYLDRNYAAVFILWDRLHGTFVREEEEPEYGITVPFNSWNPVWANFHFYVEMWEGSKRLGSIKDKLALIFRGPEYLGDLLNSKTTGPMKKYRTETPTHLKFYITLNFLLLTYFIVAFMGHFDDLTTLYQWAFFLLICLTTLTMGGLMERKKWTHWVELARLVLFLPIYNLCYYQHFQEWFVWVLPLSVGCAILFGVWVFLDGFKSAGRQTSYSE